eukprot:4250484-Amphidinium_carterae.2
MLEVFCESFLGQGCIVVKSSVQFLPRFRYASQYGLRAGSTCGSTSCRWAPFCQHLIDAHSKYATTAQQAGHRRKWPIQLNLNGFRANCGRADLKFSKLF